MTNWISLLDNLKQNLTQKLLGSGSLAFGDAIGEPLPKRELFSRWLDHRFTHRLRIGRILT